jgi:hypothetical protein
MRKVLPAMAALVLSTCGYEGQPLPPLANIPGRVTGISATERGSRLVVEFTPPQLTTEGFPIKEPLDLDVRAGPAAPPFDEETWILSARKLSRSPAADGQAAYQMPVAEWTGKDVTVGARAIGSNGKESPWSFATVPIVSAPQPPSNLRVENTATGVRLSWKGSGTAYRVFRKTGAGDFLPVADVPGSPWTDTSTQFGQEYEYRVETLVKLAENHEAESEPSAEMRIMPVDVFPPAVPSGLQIAAGPGSAELTWNGDTEPDLASYRVYRSVSGGPFERVAEVELPAWADRTVEPGKSYRYQATAVDRSGNESLRSDAVEFRLQ